MNGQKIQSLAIEEEWVKYFYLSIRGPANGLTKICKVTIKQGSYYSKCNLKRSENLLISGPQIVKQIVIAISNNHLQHAKKNKKMVSDSLGLVDFAIRLVNSVLNLPDGQVMFFEEFK